MRLIKSRSRLVMEIEYICELLAMSKASVYRKLADGEIKSLEAVDVREYLVRSLSLDTSHETSVPPKQYPKSWGQFGGVTPEESDSLVSSEGNEVDELWKSIKGGK